MSKTNLLSVQFWLWNLVRAIISGAVTSAGAVLGIAGADAVGLNVPTLDYKQLVAVLISGGVVGTIMYLKQSPLPKIDVDNESGGTITLSNGTKLPLIVLALTMLVGCTTFPNSVKQSEIAAVTASDNFMKSWAGYYVKATNNPAQYNTTLDKLNELRAKFDAAAVKLEMSCRVVDAMLASYKTNGVGKIDVTASLSALSLSANQIAIDIANILGN